MEEMKAGRELDALVAERVMGCKVVMPPRMDEPGISQKEYELRRLDQSGPRCRCEGQPHEHFIDKWDREGDLGLKAYSTDIAAAWEVADVAFHEFSIQNWKAGYSKPGWTRKERMGKRDGWWTAEFRGKRKCSRLCFISGATAPHAICLAALKAVGEIKP